MGGNGAACKLVDARGDMVRAYGEAVRSALVDEGAPFALTFVKLRNSVLQPGCEYECKFLRMALMDGVKTGVLLASGGNALHLLHKQTFTLARKPTQAELAARHIQLMRALSILSDAADDKVAAERQTNETKSKETKEAKFGDPCPICGAQGNNMFRHMGTPARCPAGHVWGATCGHGGECASNPVPAIVAAEPKAAGNAAAKAGNAADPWGLFSGSVASAAPSAPEGAHKQPKADDPCHVCGAVGSRNVARHPGTPFRCPAGHIWGGTCGHSGPCTNTPIPSARRAVAAAADK
jgi:hypothetical protein